MTTITFGKPTLRKVKRNAELVAGSYAKVKGFERAVGIHIEADQGEIILYVDNNTDKLTKAQAEEVQKFFDEKLLVGCKIMRKVELRLVPTGDYLGNTEFWAKWRIAATDKVAFLANVESAMGTDWKDAIQKMPL